jgi:hypothetical protein
MPVIERVIFTFGYYDRPLSGVSAGPQTTRCFSAVFRDDIDDYDRVYDTRMLDEGESEQFLHLFAEARIIDPACRDPARKAFADQMWAEFERLRAVHSSEIVRLAPRFTRLPENLQAPNRGGPRAAFEVEWSDPQSPSS